MNEDYALWLAGQDMKVFPVWGTSAGACMCGLGLQCGAAGKHPMELGWRDSATTDVDTIKRWVWSLPGCNIGIDCAGLIVIDIDPRHDGDKSWDEYERTASPEDLFPETRRHHTGGGGTHLVYRRPAGVDLGPMNGWLPGVDVKTDGGLVVGPGSLHVSGFWYTLDNPDVAIRELPADLVNRVLTGGRRGSGRATREHVDPLKILEGVAEGQRNDVLYQAAYERRWLGHWDENETLALILAAARASGYPDADARDLVMRVYSYDDRGAVSGYVVPPTSQSWAERVAALGSGEGGDEEVQALPLTDLGNALRMVVHAGEILRYVDGWGWLVWDGARWARDRLGVSQEAVKDMIATMASQEGVGLDRRSERAFQDHVTRSQSAPRVAACLKLASSDPCFARLADDFDQDDWVLGTTSGVVNLRTRELEVASPDRMMTKVAGTGYDAGATCPGWEAFLDRVQPVEDVRDLLQRAVGYSLTGSTSAKCMFILWGRGDNGKSVFLEVLRGVLGDYATTAQKSVFVERRSDAHLTDVASLAGVRFATFAEVRPGERLSTEVIKQLTGGDEVAARFMRQDQFTFHPKVKLWLATNHKPGVQDFGLAMRTRLRLVPWTVRIPREEMRNRDEHIAELVEEGPGILNWALRGLGAWQADQWLGETPDMEAAREEWLEDEDVFGRFVEECLESRVDVRTNNAGVNAVYRVWCRREGVDHPMSHIAVGRELKERGFVQARVGTAKGWWVRVREGARWPEAVFDLREEG